MQTSEVLNLLEQFPDLFDNDEILGDLFSQASDSPSKYGAEPAPDHSGKAKSSVSREAGEAHPCHQI